MALSEENQWINDVEFDANQARDYVKASLLKLQTFVDKLLAATQTSTRTYDKIMGNKSPSFSIGAIIGEFILEFLPQIKVVKEFGKLYATQLTDDLINRLDSLHDKYEIYTTNIITAFNIPAGSISDSNDQKTSISEAEAVLKSSNLVAQREFESYFKLLEKLTDFVNKTNEKITAQEYDEKNKFVKGQKYQNKIRVELLNDIQSQRLTLNEAKLRTSFALLERQLLYDMLKEYVIQIVTIYIDDTTTKVFNWGNQLGSYDKTGWQDKPTAQEKLDSQAIKTNLISDLPQRRYENFYEGIVQSQLDDIYLEFKSGIDGDALRPAINSYKDIIRNWKPKTKGTSGKSYNFR